jgi:excisionase family DNA binding protein
MQARPPEHYLHGEGTVVIIPARVCSYLNSYAGLREFRLATRGADAEVDAVLIAMSVADGRWRLAATGTREAAKAELAEDSDVWLSTNQVAGLLGIGDRAVRKAISTGHLPAESVAGRWRINREQLAHYKSGRATQ